MLKLTSSDYQTTAWSGGKTTQLAIAPEGAVYAERDFLWRISSATVELEESDFTPLSDYNRLIATLQGEIDLSHDGASRLHLRPFEVHRFDGGVATHSRGRCTDFNLMLRKRVVDGSLDAAILHSGSKLITSGSRTEEGLAYAAILVFCVSGQLLVENGSERFELRAGEAALERMPETMRLHAAGETGTALICKIWYLQDN